MHLLYDARLLHRPLSGLERVQRNQLRELAARPEVVRLRALVQRGAPVQVRFSNKVELVEVSDTEEILEILLDPDQSRRPDLLHLTWFPDRNPRDLFLPYAARASVLTVHDAILNRHPEYHASTRGAEWYQRFSRLLVRSVDRVLVDTDSGREEAVSDLGAERDRVDIAPLSVDPDLTGPLPADELAGRLERLGAGGDYFVAVGKDYPHKDHKTLMRALARLPGSSTLICAGTRVYQPPDGVGETLDDVVQAADLGPRVRWVSDLTDADLKALLQGSKGLVFPSREEGFGLPPLEAMHLGVPVVAADATSVPEVVGDGALLFQPGDDRELASLMQRLLAGGDEIAELVERGRRRAAWFTWERCAEATLRSYENAIGEMRDPDSPAREVPLTELLEVVASSPFGAVQALRTWQERCLEAERHAWQVEDHRDELASELAAARAEKVRAERERDQALDQLENMPEHYEKATETIRILEAETRRMDAEIARLKGLVPRWSVRRGAGKVARLLGRDRRHDRSDRS